MKEEIKYLRYKIEKLDSQLRTLRSNKHKYTTTIEISFFVSQFNDFMSEKLILENILSEIEFK